MAIVDPAVGETGTGAWADSVADALNAIGVYASWDPILTAVTTNPTLGTGGTRVGRFTQTAKLIVGSTVITFGTGATVGSGAYLIALPATAAGAALLTIGSGRVTNTGAGGTILVGIELADSTHMQVRYRIAAGFGGANLLGSGTGAWSSGDSVNFTFAYEAA